jgi:type I restriction enzyme S subunit
MKTRLRHVAKVNPLSRRFDRLADDEPVTFLPMENIWPGDQLDLSQSRPKSAVATGYTRFESGDVVVPKITPTFEASRSVVIPDVPHAVGAGTTELHVVRPGFEIDPRYLLYIFHSHDFLKLGAAEMYGVAGQKRVPDELIRDWTVDLPPLDEQRRIADFLDAETDGIEAISARRRSQISVLEELEFARIGEHLSATDIRGPVYAYFDVQLGKMLNAERASGSGQQVYLRNANVHWYEIDTEDMATMAFEPDERVRYGIQAGDLLVCEGGAGVAEAAVWDGRISTCFYQKSLHRVRPRSHVPVEWLMYWLRYSKAIGVFNADGNLATIPHLTGEQLAEYKIPIPEDGQHRVAELAAEISAIREMRRKMAAANDLLAERRQALITAAVTGAITV